MNDDHAMNPGFGEDAISPAERAEVAEIAAMLDRLGAAERAAGPAALERSVLSAALGAQSVTASGADAVIAATAEMDALARAERATAEASLEERIFLATRGLVTGEPARAHGPALRLAGGGDAPGMHRRAARWSAHGVLRAAAAVAILAGVSIAGWSMLRGMSGTGGTEVASEGASVDAANLAERVDHRLDAFLNDMDEHLTADSGNGTGSTLEDMLDVGGLLSEDSL